MSNIKNIPEYPIYGNQKVGERFDRDKGFKVPTFAPISYQNTLRYVSNILRNDKKAVLYGVGPTHGSRALRVANTMLRAGLKVSKMKATIKDSVVIFSFLVEGDFEFRERERAISSIMEERNTDATSD